MEINSNFNIKSPFFSIIENDKTTPKKRCNDTFESETSDSRFKENLNINFEQFFCNYLPENQKENNKKRKTDAIAIDSIKNQQFPLTIRLMGALQRADRFCSDEFIASAMDEELQKRDASVIRPATDSQRELLIKNDSEEEPLLSPLTLSQDVSFLSTSTEESFEQEDLSLYAEPEEWATFSQDKNGFIAIENTDFLKTAEKVVFMIRNKESGKLFIDKTEDKLQRRLKTYLKYLNDPSATINVKKQKLRNILTEIKQTPALFEIGIVPQDQSETNLKALKSRVEQNHKKRKNSQLDSNQEPVYVIAANCLTPEKYYPFTYNEERKVELATTPGFFKTYEEIKENLGDHLENFVYFIKESKTNKRYVGVSKRPEVRLKQHAYSASAENRGSFLHAAMRAKGADQFQFGLLPLYSPGHASEAAIQENIQLPTIADVEKYLIGKKQSLFSENGFNANRGGGGPIKEKKEKTEQLKGMKLFEQE